MAVIIIPQADTTSIPARFREAGATEPGRAIAWAPLGKTEEASLAKLVESGAIVEMRPGTWYLNEEKLKAQSAAQGLIVVAVALVLLSGVGLAVLMR
ncbi:MAG TPA: hypothetical protein VEZ48_11895 [Sphingomonadaceae bacterium]|nr:hypothetical protein [Sphingomonadaceae bacterium]